MRPDGPGARPDRSPSSADRRGLLLGVRDFLDRIPRRPEAREAAGAARIPRDGLVRLGGEGIARDCGHGSLLWSAYPGTKITQRRPGSDAAHNLWMYGGVNRTVISVT